MNPPLLQGTLEIRRTIRLRSGCSFASKVRKYLLLLMHLTYWVSLYLFFFRLRRNQGMKHGPAGGPLRTSVNHKGKIGLAFWFTLGMAFYTSPLETHGRACGAITYKWFILKSRY